MQLYISKNLVLQLRALRLPIAGRTARRWKPYGSQLQNGIYQELWRHNIRCNARKRTRRKCIFLVHFGTKCKGLGYFFPLIWAECLKIWCNGCYLRWAWADYHKGAGMPAYVVEGFWKRGSFGATEPCWGIQCSQQTGEKLYRWPWDIQKWYFFWR